MGFFGLGWLGEQKNKLEALKAITKDNEQLKIIDELINNLPDKED